MRALSVALAITITLQGIAFGGPPQKSFASLDDAVNALVTAIRAADRKGLVEILGPKGSPLVWSGDDQVDRAAFQLFMDEYSRAHRLEGGAGKVVLYIGDDDFPFPIPLVPDGPQWVWDTGAGYSELLNRQIGKNELSVIQVCLAYVDAQREYYSRGHGTGLLEYAQKLDSSVGKHDGLFWETQPGEQESPIGPLVVQARAAGYPIPQRGAPIPYHGYFYRILFAQGLDAADGAYDYVVSGHMIGGFALVATPAVYGASGVMTFIVNQDGIVYQKDLGPKTAQVASAMRAYNPDSTWTEAQPGSRTR